MEEIEVCNSCEMEGVTNIGNGDEILQICPNCNGIEQGTKIITVPIYSNL